MYEWDTKVDPASTNKGQIDLNQWAAQGKSMPIPRSEIEPDCDIIVNRFLKATLLHIKQSISIESVQSIAITCLGYFDGVSSAQINDCRSQVEQQFYNYPRQDYKLAVGFAEAIVDGGYFTDSAQGNQMPSFILDMNVVFEKYCAYMIKRQLDPQLYEVEIQSEYPHCSKPELSGAIQPDIVVRHKESEKCIVLDTKNKVVKFFDSPAGRLPNQDIFQLVYYSQTLLAVGALLLYPSDREIHPFPLPKSESQVNYEERVSKYLELTDANRFLVFNHGSDVKLIPWQIDLSGSLENTELSITRLCFFIGMLLS